MVRVGFSRPQAIRGAGVGFSKTSPVVNVGGSLGGILHQYQSVGRATIHPNAIAPNDLMRLVKFIIG